MGVNTQTKSACRHPRVALLLSPHLHQPTASWAPAYAASCRVEQCEQAPCHKCALTHKYTHTHANRRRGLDSPPVDCIVDANAALAYYRVHPHVGTHVGALLAYLAILHALTYLALRVRTAQALSGGRRAGAVRKAGK